MKPMSEQHFAILRRHMVELIGMHMDLMSDELGKSTLDERVVAALMAVPRHLFVPPQLIALAYHDTPLPIGFNKTISQPLIAALMIDLLAPHPGESVLEVGTGLGYQAAVLAQLARRVWSVEIVEETSLFSKGNIYDMYALAFVYDTSTIISGPDNLNIEILNTIRDDIGELSR